MAAAVGHATQLPQPRAPYGSPQENRANATASAARGDLVASRRFFQRERGERAGQMMRMSE